MRDQVEKRSLTSMMKLVAALCFVAAASAASASTSDVLEYASLDCQSYTELGSETSLRPASAGEDCGFQCTAAAACAKAKLGVLVLVQQQCS